MAQDLSDKHSGYSDASAGVNDSALKVDKMQRTQKKRYIGNIYHLKGHH